MSDPRSPRPAPSRPISGADRDVLTAKTPPPQVAAQIASGVPQVIPFVDTQPMATVDERLITISGRTKAATEGIEGATKKLEAVESHATAAADYSAEALKLLREVLAANERREQREDEIERQRLDDETKVKLARGGNFLKALKIIGGVIVGALAAIGAWFAGRSSGGGH